MTQVESTKTTDSGLITEGIHAGWFDAEKELPEENVVVIAVLEDAVILGYVAHGTWFSYPNEGYCGEDEMLPIYWCPLPDPFGFYEHGWEHTCGICRGDT